MVDILTGLIGMPLVVVLYRAERFFHQPVVNYWKIRLIWAVVDIFTILSVWHVLFITLDRFVLDKI